MYSEKLNKTLAAIRSKEGIECIVDLTSKPIEFPLLASSGSLGLDIALGGGWAKNRIIELSGAESSGKTTAAMIAIVNVQKSGGVAAFIDVEQSFDPVYFRNLGGDISSLIFSQPDNGEQALNILEALVKSGEVSLCVLDSTNALVTQAELAGEAIDMKVGLKARMLSLHLSKINSYIKEGVQSIIYISQQREKIGVFGYGDPTVIGVGQAMKFYAAQRVKFSRIGKIEVGGEYVGNKTKAVVFKNKVAPPFKEAEYDLMYGKGFSQESEIVAACLNYDVLKKTGSGVELNYPSILWLGPIGTTEENTKIALGEEAYQDVYKEIKLKLDVALGKLTEEQLQEQMKDIYEKAAESAEKFQEHFVLGNDFSGKSKNIEAIFHLREALSYNPFNKAAKDKLKAVEKRVSDKRMKGEKVDLIYVYPNGDKLNLDTSELIPALQETK